MNHVHLVDVLAGHRNLSHEYRTSTLAKLKILVQNALEKLAAFDSVEGLVKVLKKGTIPHRSLPA